VGQTAPLFPQPSWGPSETARFRVYSIAPDNRMSSEFPMQAFMSPTAESKPAPSRSRSYSADVRLYLILESGERLDLARTCDESVDLREPRLLRPGNAVMEIRVDEEISRLNIVLSPSPQAERRVAIKIA